MIRSRRPGDRVRTRAGTRKVSDVLVDAKVPRPLRDFVPVLASADGALAVVGLTRYAGGGEGMVCVQPDRPSWSRAVVWS
jgi:tRNA(Ile)-lysidine synthase